MARRLISALALGALASLGWGQAFGRFGYTEAPRQGGIIVDRSGFVACQSAADKFSFSKPSVLWRPLKTTDTGQSVLLTGGSRLPVKAKFNLLAPGPELYFESGMRLDLGSTAAPYVTWNEGSAGADIPTPDVSWVLISFKNPQPPVLLVFRDAQASVTLSGRPGDWHIITERPFRGWVRVVLPFGTEAIAAGGAAALGHQSERLMKSLADWTSPAPVLTGFSVKGDSDGVSASWSFDRPGALVPTAALLAPEGGYGLKLLTKPKVLDGETDDGPRSAVTGRSLMMRFPIRRIPNGRALGLGDIKIEAPATMSEVDIPSVADLALECLLAARDASVQKMGDDTLASYLNGADYAPEPCTAQSLPYRADGQGIDIAASQALLMQALSLSTKPSSEENSLLTSLAWRRDWVSWQFGLPSEVRARRASALGAVAGALCPEPSRRMEAAMLEAGLAAQRALDLRLLRKGTAVPARIEPFDWLRGAIFGDLKHAETTAAQFSSHTRVFGEDPITLTKSPGGIVVNWTAPDTRPHVITFVSSYALKFLNGSLRSLDVSSALGTYSLRVVAKEAGLAQFKLILPAWATALPIVGIPPAYSEPALAASLH